MEMTYILRPNTWLINGIYIYILNFMNVKIPSSFYGLSLPEIFHTEYTEWHSKIGFLLLLIIQKYVIVVSLI